MHELTDPGSEVKRLRRCMNNLVGILALPAIWSNGEPGRILETFLDALLEMLDLDFLYGTIRLEPGRAPMEVLRIAQPVAIRYSSNRVLEALHEWFGKGSRWPGGTRRDLDGEEISMFPLRLGIGGDLGLLVAGTRKASFPEETEQLILSVAANQAAIGLQHALRLDEQKRIAGELDRRVAERTRELAETNEELQLQVELLQRLPVSAWTLKPDGTADFVNQVWLDYSGQTLEFVRSHPEAWMTAVHPDDRERASKAFWDGIRSGQGFAMETRSLRARDGVYRWHLNQAVVLRDAEGKVLKFVGTTTDIHDQKAAEEVVRRSEVNLRRVIDTIPTLSWCNLPDGPNEFLSKSWHQYTGLSPEEAHGWGWAAAFHPDDLPPLMERWQKMLVSGEPGEIEARIRRFDGVYRWFLIRAEPFRDETGTILRWYGTSTDIEDRKRAEDTVLANERNLRLIIDTMPVLAWSARSDGNADFFNQRWLDYTGLTQSEVHDRGWANAFHPDDLGSVNDYWRSHILSGEQGEIEARLRRFDGSYRWFLFRANPLRDESGRIIKWYGTNTDIDDRKRAEEALRASENNFRQIVDSIPGLVCTMDANGEIEQLNRPLLEYFGKTSRELMGWQMTDAVHPDDLPAVIEAYSYSVRTGSPYAIEHRCRRADGIYRWFQVRALAVHDTNNRIRGWYVLLTDIDDRKQAEEALRMRELNLRQITETIPEMLWSASPDGAIDYCNGRLRDYTGFSPEQVMSDGWINLLHPDDAGATAEDWKACVKSRAPFRREVRTFHAADRTYRWCVMSALPLLDQEGRIVKWHGTVVDMHDWKQAQEELRHTQAELARVMRVMTVGQMTASIAHEINQPLSGIITNASTCLRMLDAAPPNVDGARETARRALRDGNRASDVIGRLRTLFSRKEIKTEPVDINEIAREVIGLYLTELQRNHVTLRQEFAEGLPRVLGDRVQLQQVILNLLRNASDAMSAVDDRPRELLLSTEPAGEEVHFKVRDAGTGIDPAGAERLFESFYTTKEDGMGIGLSVSRSIIEAHDGRLWATANDGPGATFAFSVPCSWPSERAAGLPEQALRV